jgi:hypothetical protein
MARPRELALVVTTLVAVVASNAGAVGVRSPIPLSTRARLDLQVVTSDATAPWSWDVQSRSPLDGSRFMVDLTAGDRRTGIGYVKGASTWNDPGDVPGRVDFRVEQGDYLYRLGGAQPYFSARAFGDERRYFTGELGTQLLDDDTVARFEHRLGVAIDGSHGPFGAGYLVSGLDEGEQSRLLPRASVRVSASGVHAGLAYQSTDAATGDDHAVAQGEVAAYYRRATAIVSYAQSGFGNGMFFPSGSFDGSAFHGGHYLAAAPENSATFGEARLRRVALTSSAQIDAVYRYQGVGAAYVNDLATTRRGTVSNSFGLYALHRRYALDGNVVVRDEQRFDAENSSRRTIEAAVRGFFRNNAEARIAAGAERIEYRGQKESDTGFAQGSYRRELQRFMGGLHVRVDGIGEDVVVRAAVESRIDWNPSSALTLRWIVDDASASHGVAFARLEFRPSPRTWVTLAYGWDDIGDTPYVLDDPTIPTRTDSGRVVTLTVRGDF